MITPFPHRCFQDATLPPRGADASSDDYAKWLADYLWNCQLEVPERQWQEERDLENAKSPTGWICSLASKIGWADDDLDTVAEAVNKGMSYGSFMARQIELWKEIDEANPEYLHNWVVDPGDFHQVQEEEKERRATGLDFSMIDMPYRALLAKALKRIPDPNDRVKAIHDFFGTYHDERGK